MKYEKELKLMRIFSLIGGIGYLSGGVLEILAGLDMVNLPLIAPDFMGGFTMIIIGGIYLHGVAAMSKKEIRSLGFPLVASILAAAFALLFTLILIANAVEAYVLLNEDYIGWVIWDDIRPEIYLFPLTLPIITILWKLIMKERIVRIL